MHRYWHPHGSDAAHTWRRPAAVCSHSDSRSNAHLLLQTEQSVCMARRAGTAPERLVCLEAGGGRPPSTPRERRLPQMPGWRNHCCCGCACARPECRRECCILQPPAAPACRKAGRVEPQQATRLVGCSMHVEVCWVQRRVAAAHGAASAGHHGTCVTAPACSEADQTGPHQVTAACLTPHSLHSVTAAVQRTGCLPDS